jgi:citronellol/citronellal dehydrogenase
MFASEKILSDKFYFMEERVVIITGSSRGIGRAIALHLASLGYRIVVIGKSVEEDPRLGGTIYSVVDEIKSAGGIAIAVPCDIRFDEQIDNVVAKTLEAFGQIDVLINNASAIDLSPMSLLASKKYDLMFDINVRGSFMMSKACIPHIKKSENGHILFMSPPLPVQLKWLDKYLAYALSKFNMSFIAIGLSNELRRQNVAVNTLWPKTTIDTAAVRNLIGGEALVQKSRKPQIVADAVEVILNQYVDFFTGNCLIDEHLLREHGVADFTPYAVNPDNELQPDLFV